MRGKKLFRTLSLSLCLMGVVFWASAIMAAQITIAWDPVANVDGYKIYYGTSSGNYQQVIDVGDATTYTLSGLQEGSVYYVAVTSYVNGGSESEFSNELVVSVTKVDTDNDGISDYDEVNLYGTDPNNPDTDGDGISDYDEILQGTDPLHKDAKVTKKAQLVTNYANFNHGWTTVQLPKAFTRPVVIAGPPTYKDSQPGIVRIDGIGADTFDIRFQEWNYLDGRHTQESAAYLVMDEGRYELDDGSIWEVGTFSLSGNGNWQYIPFYSEFPSPPKVFLTVQTSFDSQPVLVRARYVSTSGFEAAMFHEEANKNAHGVELIGYVAIWNSSGYGNIAGIPYAVGSAVVNSSWCSLGGFQLLLQEEQSADFETYHIEEVVDVLVLGEQVFAQNVWWVDHDPASLRINW